MQPAPRSIAVIGGGIVGLATAHALLRRRTGREIIVLEAEPRLAAHQTGHNSGVIHSGLYYRPGSLKAKGCVEGRERLLGFCREEGIAHEVCGKLVVATVPGELPALEALARRGEANGLGGIVRVEAGALADYEPHVRGVGGLWVPQTGIIDFARVAAALGRRLTESGAEIRTNARVVRVRRRSEGFVLELERGEQQARWLINCAGLQSDRIARLCGLDPGLAIVPFRGEYYDLVPERRHLVRNLIYPVPDPRLPFLGVHLTRAIDGRVHAGPSAVLALSRRGYRRATLSARDLFGVLSYPGFWRLAAVHWRTGVAELHRSLSKAAWVRAVQGLVPELGPADLERNGSGVRAQALGRDGALVDDFRTLEAEGMLHVLNAPSPAATASLSIGADLAERAERLFGLN